MPSIWYPFPSSFSMHLNTHTLTHVFLKKWYHLKYVIFYLAYFYQTRYHGKLFTISTKKNYLILSNDCGNTHLLNPSFIGRGLAFLPLSFCSYNATINVAAHLSYYIHYCGIISWKSNCWVKGYTHIQDRRILRNWLH